MHTHTHSLVTVCYPLRQLPSMTSVRTEVVWSAPWTMPFSLARGVVWGQMWRSLTMTPRLHSSHPISTCSRKCQKKHSVSFILNSSFPLSHSCSVPLTIDYPYLDVHTHTILQLISSMWTSPSTNPSPLSIIMLHNVLNFISFEGKYYVVSLFFLFFTALLDRIEEFGREICHHNSLPDPLSVAQPSLVS